MCRGREAVGQEVRGEGAIKAGRGLELVPVNTGEEGGARGGAVKFIDVTKNTDCGGSLAAR